MAKHVYLLSCLWLAVSAAPPSPPRLYQQQAPAQLQQINPYDYYLENQEVANYYNQAQQKQGNPNAGSNGAPSRLETLEPDSEVELIPGAQTPQQPPQQNPVSPNIPGLVPGQRVFIVHMPVPGYRPGTIGGYQPVYIVAAAPQGNSAYPANGYQNAVLLDPSGQAVISPIVGYPRQFGIAQGGNPNLLLGSPLINRPFDLGYQEPVIAYQPVPGPQGAEGPRGSVRLNQFVGLQGGGSPANNARTGNNESEALTEPKRLAEASESNETKDQTEELRRRPNSAQQRNKVKK
ncbi:uncharacterized protein LOC106139762 isoform X2 [Amyelois transitella]|uniref:uncharacterized protein LOC106139762 isoform X2 n=1 Tax=Amyelois transitella TaxID=680683 RepID=UPI002990414D|nr:uncharacterized protein LOC106139762 isoform X2 [Amyelois transitella]